MTKILLNLVGIGCLALILAGCGSATQESGPPAHEPAAGVEAREASAVEKEETPIIAAETEMPESVGEAASPIPLSDLPQPVNDLTEADYHWSQLLPRDGIRPIYENEVEFVEAGHAPYADDELVIGVEINGQAKAYAIGPLNSREMVNDTVGGVPILVTW